MAESFDDAAELSITISGAKAASGAAQIVSALKGIQAASARTAEIAEQELGRRMASAAAAAAARVSAASAKAARDSQREQEKAAKAGAAAVKEAEREKVAASKAAATARAKDEAAVARAAREAGREMAAAMREVERITKQASRESAAAWAKAEKEKAASAKKTANDQKQAMKETEGSAISLRNVMLAAVTGTVATSIVKTIASYEGLKSSLITATKSASGAEVAFKDLQGFADKTPYTLEQATKAYIRMSSAGLKPSIAALTDFGDIASAIPGKDILDFVEAVADGTQGQGRRLKEFGIDLDVMGDKVRLKFGHMALTVKNDAASIEAGLRKIATANFGGSMDRQSRTLAGLWSTLQDKAAGLANEIGEGGLRLAMQQVVYELTDLSSGSKDTAHSVGSVLGDGVRAAADAARFLVTHLAEVKSVLVGIAAYKAAASIAAVTTSLQAATAAAGGFRLAMITLAASNPLGWVVVAAAGLAEIIQHWDTISKFGAGKTPGGVEYSGVSMMGDDMGMSLTEDSSSDSGSPAPTAAQKAWMQAKVDSAGEALMGMLNSAKNKREGEALAATITAMYASGDAGGKAQRDRAKNPASGSGEKKKVDALATSLANLKREASDAETVLGMIQSGADARALAIEAEVQAQIGSNKVTAEGAAEIRKWVTAKYDATTASETLTQAEKDYQESLKKTGETLTALKKRSADSSQILKMTRSGASSRDIEIATRMQGLDTTGMSPEAIAEAKKQITIDVDASRALKALGELQGLQDKLSEKQDVAGIYASGLRGKDREKALYVAKGLAQLGPELTANDRAQAAALLEQNYAIEEQIKGYERLDQVRSEWIDFAIEGIDKFAGALTDALDGQEHAWRDFFIQLAASAAQLALTQATGEGGALNGGGASGGLLAGVFHNGGMVGSGGSYRSVSPSVFRGATRYHTGGYAGLKPDEIPAILQRGERVQSKRELAQGGLRGRSQRNYAINLAIHASDGNSVKRALPSILRGLRQITNRSDDD